MPFATNPRLLSASTGYVQGDTVAPGPVTFNNLIGGSAQAFASVTINNFGTDAIVASFDAAPSAGVTPGAGKIYIPSGVGLTLNDVQFSSVHITSAGSSDVNVIMLPRTGTGNNGGA